MLHNTREGREGAKRKPKLHSVFGEDIHAYRNWASCWMHRTTVFLCG